MSKRAKDGSLPLWHIEGYPHVWMPYTQMHQAPLPLPAVEVEGCRIHLADGTTLIDGIASWWSVCHGHRHPHIVKAIEKQLKTLPHVMFGGLVHEPALTLARRLCAIVPDGLTRVFFSDSGSVAVEVAMKMALQYWRNKNITGKDRFICFRNGYHGDTMGAMSVSDPAAMHKAYRNSTIMQYVLDIPSDEYSLSEFEEMVKGIHGQVAGLIIEPLVQAAGGMRFHSADVLAEIHRICKHYNVLFIADEIATGFGRTGFLFACDEAGISPDIMCIGKALTGGTITLGATLAQEAIFEAFLGDNLDMALMHGPTFMANPLACTAANASLDLFESEPRIAQVEAIEKHFQQALEACSSLPFVTDVRVKGALGVVELEPQNVDVQWLRKRFIEHGVWVRPLKNIVYLMPPFVISPEELATLTDAVIAVVGEWSTLEK